MALCTPSRLNHPLPPYPTNTDSLVLRAPPKKSNKLKSGKGKSYSNAHGSRALNLIFKSIPELNLHFFFCFTNNNGGSFRNKVPSMKTWQAIKWDDTAGRSYHLAGHTCSPGKVRPKVPCVLSDPDWEGVSPTLPTLLTLSWTKSWRRKKVTKHQLH